MTETPVYPSGGASDEDILRELKLASAGLNYPSESDAPFNVFCWKTTERDALKQILANEKADAKTVETSVADFFAELVAGEDGMKFEHLRRVTESRLTAMRVLRIGSIEVDVYLVGRTPTGNWAGLHTTSVET